MAKKTVNYNRQNINKLPNDKPVMYRIKTGSGHDNYVGLVQKGRVRARIAEHLGEIPGAKVEIEQFNSIKGAQKKEANVIKRSKPKYNKHITASNIIFDSKFPNTIRNLPRDVRAKISKEITRLGTSPLRELGNVKHIGSLPDELYVLRVDSDLGVLFQQRDESIRILDVIPSKRLQYYYKEKKA